MLVFPGCLPSYRDPQLLQPIAGERGSYASVPPRGPHAAKARRVVVMAQTVALPVQQFAAIERLEPAQPETEDGLELARPDQLR